MIPPGSLGEENLVLRELLLVGERDTINSLQGIIVLVTEEVRGRILGIAFEINISAPAFAFGDVLS